MINEDEIQTIKYELISNKDNNLTNFDVYLASLLEVEFSNSISQNCRVLCSDTLCIWITRCCQYKSRYDQENNINDVSNGSIGDYLALNDLDALFKMIIEHLDSARGASENSLMKLLSKIIAYIRSFKRASLDKIIEKWVDVTFDVSNTSRGPYLVIGKLAKELESDYIIRSHPEEIRIFLKNMQYDPLANIIGHALYSIFNARYEQESDTDWLDIWEPFVVEGLSITKASNNIQTYLVESLLRRSPIARAEFMKRHFAVRKLLTTNDIMLHLGFLKIDLTLSSFSEQKCLRGSFQWSQLIPFLRHQDSKVRLTAFSLFTIASKGSEKVDAAVYEQISENLEILSTEFTVVEYRNEFFSLLRNFMFRIQRSTHATASKMRKKCNTEELLLMKDYLTHSESFLNYLVQLSNSCLRPCCSYAQLLLGLTILQIFTEMSMQDHFGNKAQPKSSKQSRNNNQTFLPFKVEFADKKSVMLLFDNLRNNYEDVRSGSKSLLLKFLDYKLLNLSDKDIKSALSNAFTLLSDLKGRKFESGALAIGFISEIWIKSENFSNFMDLLNEILQNLEVEISHDTSTRKAHGLLCALKNIVPKISLDMIKANSIWRVQFSRIFNSIFKIWDAIKSNIVDVLEGNPENNTHSSYISSYYWKTIREAALLLTSIFITFEVEILEVVEADSIFKLNRLLVEQLASIKHRGSLSAISESLETVSWICRKSDYQGLNAFPDILLKETLDLIVSKVQYISRRSGGLPYILSSLLTSMKRVDLDFENKFSDIIRDLMSIIIIPYEVRDDERMDIPQVHAYNCLRSIIGNSKLAYVNESTFVGILELVLRDLNSPSWSIRNCAFMLFSEMQVRMFGTNKVNEEAPRISIKMFLSKYEGMNEILLREINRYNEKPHSFNSVFAVLSILSRLETFMEDDCISSSYQEALSVLMSSKIWKVRELSSSTLAYISSPRNFKQKTMKILEDCNISGKRNFLHGRLLFILESLKRFQGKSSASFVDEEVFSLLLSKATHQLAQRGPFHNLICYYYLNNILIMNSNSRFNIPANTINFLGNIFLETLKQKYSLDGTKQLFLCSLQEALLKYYHVTQSAEEFHSVLYISLRDSSNFKVQISAINIVDDILTNSINTAYLELACIRKELIDLLKDCSTWSHVKSSALHLISKIKVHPHSIGETKEVLNTLLLVSGSYYEIHSDALLAFISILSSSYSKELEAYFSESLYDKCISCVRSTDDAKTKQKVVIELGSLLSCSNNTNNNLKLKIIFFLNDFVNDSNEGIRDSATSGILRFFGKESLASAFIRKTFELCIFDLFGRNEIFKICGLHYKTLLSSIQNKISLILEVDEDALFDLDTENTYVSDILRTSQLSDILKDSANNNGDDSLNVTGQAIHLAEGTREILTKHGYDGQMGWSRENFIYTCLHQVLICCNTIICLERSSILSSKVKIVHELMCKFNLQPDLINIQDH